MDTYTIKICPLTQSPEKFICLNQECWSTDKKQLVCYECLNKQHFGKNKTIRHLDEFIDIDRFMKQIIDKCKQKETLLNTLILSCNDFQKQKIQQIELTQKSDVAKLAREKIENDVSSLVSLLGQESMRLKSLSIYSASNHRQLMKCYFENEQLFLENMKLQFKQLVERVSTFVLSLDCDIKQQISKLEEKTKQLQNTTKITKICSIQNPTLLLIIISVLLSYFLNQHHLNQQIQIMKLEMTSQFNETNSKVQALEMRIFGITELKSNSVDFNLIVHELNQSVIMTTEDLNNNSENIEKLKQRFDAFKRGSSNSIAELKNQIASLNGSLTSQSISLEQFNETSSKLNQLNLKFENLAKDQQEQFSTQLQNLSALSHFLDTQQISQSFNIKEINETQINPISEDEENYQNKSEIQQKQYGKFNITQKERILAYNQDLIGKIHLNLSLTRLNSFTLIYDHFLTKYVSLSKMDSLFKIATQNNEDALICIGGLKVSNLSQFQVAACDFATEVFEPTFDIRKARKSQNGDIYWYLVDYFSFGFSPKENILLGLCDDAEPEDERRLSYWFGTRARFGGRRIGKGDLLENSTDHKMQIYMLR